MHSTIFIIETMPSPMSPTKKRIAELAEPRSARIKADSKTTVNTWKNTSVQDGIVIVEQRDDGNVTKALGDSSASGACSYDAVKRMKANIAKAELGQVKAETEASRAKDTALAARDEVKRALEELKKKGASGFDKRKSRVALHLNFVKI